MRKVNRDNVRQILLCCSSETLYKLHLTGSDKRVDNIYIFKFTGKQIQNCIPNLPVKRAGRMIMESEKRRMGKQVICLLKRLTGAFI